LAPLGINERELIDHEAGSGLAADTGGIFWYHLELFEQIA
jgi:hypothetical protein